MTNFSGSQRQTVRWFTPERWVLLLPMAGGAVVLVLQVLVLLPPLLLQVQQRREAIGVLESKQAGLPQLRLELVTAQSQVQAKTAQQQRLLTLVAGTDELRTWLSGLNDIAAASGVIISQVEPGPLEVFTPPSPPPAEGQPAPAPAAAPSASAPDPLLVANLQKRSAAVTVRGAFSDLRRFLQQLEALEIIAIASDLQLGTSGQGALPGLVAQQSAPPAAGGTVPRLEMKLKLSAYGRAPRRP